MRETGHHPHQSAGASGSTADPDNERFDDGRVILSSRTAGTLLNRDLLVLGARRTAEMAAIFMIGDGLLGVSQPERHMELWRSSIAPLDAVARPFGGHALRRRFYGVLQVATGLIIASACRPPRGRDAGN
jgi:hypothetical protein